MTEFRMLFVVTNSARLAHTSMLALYIHNPSMYIQNRDYSLNGRNTVRISIQHCMDMYNKKRHDFRKLLLNQLQDSFPTFSWVGFMNLKGNVLASTDGILRGENLSERPVYQEGIKGKFIGDVHDAVLLAKLLPNPTGEPLQFVDISFPLKYKNGEIAGVLAAHLSWAWAKEVEKSVLEPLKHEEKDIEMFIVSQKENTVLLKISYRT